jgi:hypothetical protein
MGRLGKSIMAGAAAGALLNLIAAEARSQENPAAEAKPKPAAETHAPFRRTVFTGNEMLMGVFNTLASDCSAVVRPDVRIVTPPANGVVRFDAIIAAVERPPGDIRAVCNGKRAISVGIFYKSNKEFVGADHAALEIDFRQGFVGRFSYDIEVR